MKVIAHRQLRGDYGVVAAGAEFDAQPHIAQDLLKRGLVTVPDSRETKVVAPPEIKSARIRRTKGER